MTQAALPPLTRRRDHHQHPVPHRLQRQWSLTGLFVYRYCLLHPIPLSITGLSRLPWVNAVASGPVWTRSSHRTPHREDWELRKYGPSETGRAAEEVAPCYSVLASQDSSYMTGQVLLPNGGTVVNGW